MVAVPQFGEEAVDDLTNGVEHSGRTGGVGDGGGASALFQRGWNGESQAKWPWSMWERELILKESICSRKGGRNGDGGRVGGDNDKEREKKAGGGVAELDACKIRSEKMRCDQADCRQRGDGHSTDRQSNFRLRRRFPDKELALKAGET